MSETEPNSRQIDLSIELPHPASEVWKALTTAEGIVNWLAPEASVTPGSGGVYTVSWGGGMGYSQQIEIWEPGRHLRTISTRDKGQGPVKMYVDWFIQAQSESTCTLRLVHSGFGSGADWDGEYDGTTKGWKIFLRNLANSLPKPGGAPCRSIFRTVMLPRPVEDVWQQCVGEQAGGLHLGDDLSLALGEKFDGRVELFNPPNFVIVANGTRQQILTLMIEGGQQSFFTLLLQTFGLPDDVFTAKETQWLSWIDAMRQAPTAAVTP